MAGPCWALFGLIHILNAQALGLDEAEQIVPLRLFNAAELVLLHSKNPNQLGLISACLPPQRSSRGFCMDVLMTQMQQERHRLQLSASSGHTTSAKWFSRCLKRYPSCMQGYDRGCLREH